MTNFLWNNILRDTFFKIHCKQCKFKSMFAIAIFRHLLQEHNIKPTKKDLHFLFRYNLLTRLLMSAVTLPLFVVCGVLKVVLLAVVFPLSYIYEIL